MRLRLLVGAAALAPIVLLGAVAGFSYVRALERAGDEVQRLARTLAIETQGLFATHRQALGRVGELALAAEAQGLDEAWLHERLATIRAEDPAIMPLSIIGPDGLQRGGSEAYPLPRVDISDREFFRYHRDNPSLAPHLGPPVVSRLSGDVIFTLTRRLDRDGVFAGVAVSAFVAERLSRRWASLSTDGELTVSLMRLDGQLYARQPPARSLEPYSEEGIRRFVQAADREPVIIGSPVDGIRRVNFSTRLADYPLLLTAGLSTTHALLAWKRELFAYGAICVFGSLATLGFALLAARHMRRGEAERARVHAAQEAQLKAESALHQAQKMEAVGQLTSGIAHDFNNLLAAVIGNLDLARRRIGDEARLRPLLDAAQRAAERGAKLTEQLLAFARRQHLEPQAFNLDRMLERLGDLLPRTTGPAVQVERVSTPDLWTVQADPSQIEVAVLNLAINARDAMPLGGRMTITTGNLPAGHPRLPESIRSKDCVLLAVSDTGTGMSGEVRARAFDPFYTTKEVGKGTGLGLSQVQGVARQSGGDVLLDSEPGKGTTVTLFLPRSLRAEPDQGPQALAPDHFAPVGADATVLVVDDDPDVRGFTAATLTSFGYRVVEAADGWSGLQRLEEEAIDLLVADFAMPGMNGGELIQRARVVAPGLQVLLVTGYAELEAELPPGTVTLKKPFRIEDLELRVRQLIGAGSDSATVVPFRRP